MYPLVISLLGAVLLAFSMAATQPRDMEIINQARADAMAANFWTYRGALVSYQNDPSAIAPSGTLPLASLQEITPTHPIGYFPPGYQMLTTGTPATNLWSNYFQGAMLYTFSTIPAAKLPSGVIDAIANRNGRSMMIGIRQTNGTMVSMFMTEAPPPKSVATFALPALAAIPIGALVVVGN